MLRPPLLEIGVLGTIVGLATVCAVGIATVDRLVETRGRKILVDPLRGARFRKPLPTADVLNRHWNEQFASRTTPPFRSLPDGHDGTECEAVDLLVRGAALVSGPFLARETM